MVGSGLNFSFIYAWKSGRNPSASKDTINKARPIIYTFLQSPCFAQGSNTLNKIIPVVTIMAMIIFLAYNFKDLLLTLEHITPTKITESMLQDLNITTIGQLTIIIAQLFVNDERKIKKCAYYTVFCWNFGLILRGKKGSIIYKTK